MTTTMQFDRKMMGGGKEGAFDKNYNSPIVCLSLLSVCTALLHLVNSRPRDQDDFISVFLFLNDMYRFT